MKSLALRETWMKFSLMNASTKLLAKNNLLLQLGAWLFFGLTFFLSISGVATTEGSLKITLAIFLPSIPVVYLHLYLLSWMLKSRNYLLYVLFLFGLIFFFGKLIDLTAERIFPEDDQLFLASKLVLILFILVSAGLKYFFLRLLNGNKMMELQMKQHKAELDSLRLQLNPHFLFNSLNNIYGLMNENVDKAGESLLALSALLRYMSYTSHKNNISLEEEIKFVEDYVAMERLRLGEKCSIHFKKKGDFSRCMLPPFILIPFVENAFKHGSYATIQESYINIEATLKENTFYFTVHNSIKSEQSENKGGVGISNARRRLALLLPENHKLDVQKNSDSFKVNLIMELSC